MTTDDFEYDTDDEWARREAIIRRARVEGIEAAYESALRVCMNDKAPAQAQANASRTLLQIGGLLDRADREKQNETKPLNEMTGEELAEEIARAKARQGGPKKAGLFD
jgi:hypothetical protein